MTLPRCRLTTRHPNTKLTIRGFSTGGLSIVGGKGKIDINNTLDERLKLLQDDSLPAVRKILFGKNTNRKFYD